MNWKQLLATIRLGDQLGILVVNVMNDEIGWGWANTAKIIDDPSVRGALVRLPLIKSTEATKAKLLAEIRAR